MREVKEKKSISDTIADAIDAAMTPFFPKAVLTRKVERYALSRSNAYRGAKNTRRNENWLPTSGSADQDLLYDLPKLRERSRDLNRNNAYAAGITASIVTNVVGHGIRAQCRVDAKKLGFEEADIDTFQRDCEKAWAHWVEVADAGGRLDFYAIQAMVQRQILENGEVFIAPLMVKRAESRYMLRLQIIEADRVSTPAELISDKSVRSGIRVDDQGRPVAYYVRKSHPGDYRYRKHTGNGMENYIKYDAVNELGRPNILHLYYQKRPGQTRGEPFFSTVIDLFKDLDDYMEAELTAAKVAACFSVFVRRNNPTSFGIGNTKRIEDGKRIETLSPGIIEYLQPDEDISFANPDRPGSNFSPFVEQTLRTMATALNLPFEAVFRDFRRSNYSSVRAALQEARRYYRTLQMFLQRELCQPVWEMFMEEAFLIGDLPVKKFYDSREDMTKARWIAPGWGWVDPTKEVDAARSAVEGLLSTHADETAALGKDYEEVYEQLAREKKKREELGIEPKPAAPKRMLIQEEKEEEIPA